MTLWSGQSTWSRGLGARNAVPLGDYVIPRRVEWHFEGDNGDPDLWAFFEYRDGRPQCVAVRVAASKHGRAVRTSDFQLLEVDKMTVTAFSRFAMRSSFDPETNVTTMEPVDDERDLWRVIDGVEEAIKAPRRGVTQAEIEKVAEIYLDNVRSDPTREVEVQMRYGSRRTAERRIKQAEEAGLLPTTTPGKKRTGKVTE